MPPQLVACFVGRKGVGKTTLLRSLAPWLSTGRNPQPTKEVKQHDATLLGRQLKIIDSPGFDSPDRCTSVFHDIETQLASTGIDIVVLCVAGDERLTDEEIESLQCCANELNKRGLDKRTVVAFTKTSGEHSQQEREHAYRKAVPQLFDSMQSPSHGRRNPSMLSQAADSCVWIQATKPPQKSREALLRYMELVTEKYSEPGSFRVIQSSSSRDGGGKTWRQWMWERRFPIGVIVLVCVVTGVALYANRTNSSLADLERKIEDIAASGENALIDLTQEYIKQAKGTMVQMQDSSDEFVKKMNGLESRIADLVAENKNQRIQHEGAIKALMVTIQKSGKAQADKIDNMAALMTKQQEYVKEAITGMANSTKNQFEHYKGEAFEMQSKHMAKVQKTIHSATDEIKKHQQTTSEEGTAKVLAALRAYMPAVVHTWLRDLSREDNNEEEDTWLRRWKA